MLALFITTKEISITRTKPRPVVTAEHTLTSVRTQCDACGQGMWITYHTFCTVTTLSGSYRLTLQVRRCRNQHCARYHQSYRPEEEGQWALPHGEFGLDVIALVGSLRYGFNQFVLQPLSASSSIDWRYYKKVLLDIAARSERQMNHRWH